MKQKGFYRQEFDINSEKIGKLAETYNLEIGKEELEEYAKGLEYFME